MECESKWIKASNYTAPQLRSRAVYLSLEENKSIDEIHEMLGISTKSIRLYIKRKLLFGHIYSDEELKKMNNKKYKRNKSRHVIVPLCGILIKTFVALKGTITLDELRVKLQDNGYDVSSTAIHYYLESERLSLKVITRVEY